ncbi:MAG: hypothetical protein J6T74_09310 [Clostridia bacterium]|nr:hypothetical protein [Clostridia bacterium]
MENLQESKIIEINDLNNKYKFRINLFNVEEGLNFFLKSASNQQIDTDKIEILLKQAILLNEKQPELNQKFSLELAKITFRNPVSIIKLATEIMEFQSVFLKDFKI